MNHSSPLFDMPVMEESPAVPGKRVRCVAPEYRGTQLYHTLYLPPEWTPDPRRRFPVIFEYPGNLSPPSGSTGRVEDAGLGYGLTRDLGFIWVVLPFVDRDAGTHALTWWGDGDGDGDGDAAATAEYCVRAAEQVCRDFGGDRNNLFLCGFSRGAIAVNYIGLRNPRITGLWRGLISHDHYDGVREWRGTDWGSPLDAYRRGAADRLDRARGKRILVMQQGETESIRSYLGDWAAKLDITFLDIPVGEIIPDIPNPQVPHVHTDRWPYYASDARDRARRWITQAYT
jgi:hypothetical protein